jgi:hypothetical protein
MTDWSEFLTSEEFKSYRRKQLEAVTQHVHGMLGLIRTPADAERLIGGLHMAYKLIKIPLGLTQDPNFKQALNGEINADLTTVSTELIRRGLAESTD